MRFLKTSTCLLLALILLVTSFSAVFAIEGDDSVSQAEKSTRTLQTSATVPYTTYIYNYEGEPITTPHGYTPTKVYSGSNLGVGDFVSAQDIDVADNGNILVVDSDYIPDGSYAGDADFMGQRQQKLVASNAASDENLTDSGSSGESSESTEATSDDSTADTNETAEGEESTEGSEEKEEATVTIDESSLPEEMRSDIEINSPEDLVKYVDMLPETKDITIDYGSRIKKMYETYDTFTDDERVKVTNKEKLEAAEKYLAIDMPVNANTGLLVDKYLAIIPDIDDITINHEPRIAAINEAYNKLSSAEKAKVTGKEVLDKAIQKMYYSSSLDVRTGDAMDKYIALLPETSQITADYESRIQALLIAYRKLSSDEVILVTKKAILDAAEYKLDEFQCAEQYETRKGRIVVFNNDMTEKFAITEFNNDGHMDGFFEPMGVTVAPNGNIYVADSGNARVVEFDGNGKFVRDIKDPQISNLSSNIAYCPVKVSVDTAGNMYVVAKNNNMGVLLLDNNGDFTGFVGAQQVVYSAIDYLWKSILTEEQQARMESFVPTEYNNIVMDDEGFVYVTTSSIQGATIKAALDAKQTTTAAAPVKRLNPSGNDVLLRRGYFMPCGDVMFKMDSVGNYECSVLIDVAVSDENQRYTVLDRQKNRLFTYSKNGELLYAFGGEGTEAGNSMVPTAIAYDGDDLLLLDSRTGYITRYSITTYGELIDRAYYYYYEYEYDTSVKIWQEVLEANANFDIAYDGIANAYLRTGDYKLAMEYYTYSNNADGYSNALEKYRTYCIENYLLIIVAVIIVVIFLIVRIFKAIGKRNRDDKYIPKRGKLWNQLCYSIYVIVHPFDGFWDLKHEKRGSVLSATIILVLVYISNVASKLCTAYLFNTNYGLEVQFLFEAMMILFPLLLWVVSNWAVTTLMDGEGKMKDIYIFTAYALTPSIILSILSIVLSHFMIADEAMYITFFSSLSTVWCGFLIFSANTTTHRYTVGKSIGSIIVSIIGIAIIVFVLLVIISTYQSMFTFIQNIFKEITYRA